METKLALRKAAENSLKEIDSKISELENDIREFNRERLKISNFIRELDPPNVRPRRGRKSAPGSTKGSKFINAIAEFLSEGGKNAATSQEIIGYLAENGFSLHKDKKRWQSMLSAILGNEMKRQDSKIIKVARGVYALKDAPAESLTDNKKGQPANANSLRLSLNESKGTGV